MSRDAPRGAEELEFFADQTQTLHSAMSRAARSRLRTEAMHPHQYRVGDAACAELAKGLVAYADLIAKASNFTDLHDAVRISAAGVYRVGELTIYDVAHRIGVYLGLHPGQVFLHRGTREGARALGVNGNRLSIPIDEFPAELQVLTAAQLEDVLCIYKADLERLSRS